MSAKKHGRVVLIHGARYKQADQENFRRLATGFRATGFSVILPTYGYLPALVIGLFQWLDRRIADSIASFITEDDILLGHSNGGTLVYLISQQVKVRGVVLINPALDPELTPDAGFVHVYYNRGDILTRLSALFPFHHWGDMGAIGYKGNDHRVTNFDQENTPTMPSLKGHADVFDQGNVRPWSRFMAERCLESLANLKLNCWSNCHD